MDLICCPREFVEVYDLLNSPVPERVCIGERHPVYAENANSMIVQPPGVAVLFSSKHVLIEAVGAIIVSDDRRVYPGPWANVVGEVDNKFGNTFGDLLGQK